MFSTHSGVWKLVETLLIMFIVQPNSILPESREFIQYQINNAAVEVFSTHTAFILKKRSKIIVKRAAGSCSASGSEERPGLGFEPFSLFFNMTTKGEKRKVF